MEAEILYSVMAEAVEVGDLINVDGSMEEIISHAESDDGNSIEIITDNGEYLIPWDDTVHIYGYSTVLI